MVKSVDTRAPPEPSEILSKLELTFAKLITECETELKRQIHGSISLGLFFIIFSIKKVAQKDCERDRSRDIFMLKSKTLWGNSEFGANSF